MPRMPAHEMTSPLPTVGRSIGRGGLKPIPPVSPSDDGVERHVPGEADDDHRHQDGEGDGEVAAAQRRLDAVEDRAESAGR